MHATTLRRAQIAFVPNADVGPGHSDMNIRAAKSFAIRKELVDVTGIEPATPACKARVNSIQVVALVRLIIFDRT